MSLENASLKEVWNKSALVASEWKKFEKLGMIRTNSLVNADGVLE